MVFHVPVTLGAKWAGLDRDRHTVPRAELQAVVVVLQQTAAGGRPDTVWSDCSFVVNGFAKGVRNMIGKANAHLWAEAMTLMTARPEGAPFVV